MSQIDQPRLSRQQLRASLRTQARAVTRLYIFDHPQFRNRRQRRVRRAVARDIAKQAFLAGADRIVTKEV